MVYGIQTGGRGGRRILRNRRVKVMQSCGQCRWEGAMHGWLMRAQKPRSKTISGKGRDAHTKNTQLSIRILNCEHRLVHSVLMLILGRAPAGTRRPPPPLPLLLHFYYYYYYYRVNPRYIYIYMYPSIYPCFYPCFYLFLYL